MKKLFLLTLLVCAGAVLRAASESRCRYPTEQAQSSPIAPADFVHLHSDHFRLYLESESPTDAEALELLETVRSRFLHLMRREGFVLHSAQPFTWLWFNDRSSYEDYSRQADGIRANPLKSYYSAKTNRVAVLTDTAEGFWMDNAADPFEQSHQVSASDYSDDPREEASPDLVRAMLAHELIHQLAFNTGLQTRGVEYPMWASEGMATAFEYIYRDPQLRDGNRYRQRTVLELYAHNRLIPLGQFVSMSRISWPGLTDSEIYAQCWAFFDFLWHNRKPQLKQYLEQAGSRRVGSVRPAVLVSEFTDCFGALDGLEIDWINWLSAKSVNN
jgi:hypothetical protein